MVKNLIILTVLIGAVAGWTIYDNRNQTATPVSYDEAPAFDYTTLQGKQGKLSDHKDRIIIIHFWATWCAPCLIEFPELMALAEGKKDKTVVLAIAVEDKKENIERFLTKLDINLPPNVHIVLDKEKAVSAGLYETVKLPETFIVSKDTKLLEKIAGPQDDWNSGRWGKKIDRFYGE
jgi:thiol-disulfide isomerase/thioredoxin